MLKKLRRAAGRHLLNMPGWRTNRKIVVIESDDWGSIRMPSKRVYDQCLKAGYRVDKIAYERFDSLASEDDLELLFDVLSKYKDEGGNPAVITANILTANPDFEKIKESGFKEYFYELVTDTFKAYPKHSNCFNLWNQGKESQVFYPQSHGREHLNVSLFMETLRKGDPDVLFGFKHKMPGSIPKDKPKLGNKFVESLRYNSQKDKEEKLSIVIEGLDLFERLLGYQSKTFIPPNHLWSPDYDQAMASKGVAFYQGNRKMREPQIDGSFKLHDHKLGEENKLGQRYLVRNAIFEPAMFNSAEDPVVGCLRDISIAFKMNKPAVICTHRLNYVGFIDENNRDKNLKMLATLLGNILQKWPQVKFLNSEELGKLMVHENGRDFKKSY